MRLAVFSDLHGNWTAFQAALADYEQLGGADHVWVLGDLAAMGSRPSECIRQVKAMADAAEAAGKKGTFRMVRGNTDRYLVTGMRPRASAVENADDFERMRKLQNTNNLGLLWGLNQITFEDYEVLRNLSSECDLHVDGFGYIIGYHGTPGDDEGFLKPDTSEDEAADALMEREGHLGIGGHIHEQMDRRLKYNHWRVINVGSVGMSFNNPGYAQWGLFTFENGDVRVDLRNIPYDVDAAVADVYAVGYPAPEWLENRLRNGNR